MTDFASPLVSLRSPGALRRVSPALLLSLLVGLSLPQAGCDAGGRLLPAMRVSANPLTVSRAVGQYDLTRDASLNLVIEGLDEDGRGRPSRALAKYQRAIRVDSTNPFAFLALARHHLEGGSSGEASAFLDQARALFEAEGSLGPEIDVWGLGLRAGIDRAEGKDDRADALFAKARDLSPRIWGDERLSAAELR